MITVALIIIGLVVWLILETKYQSRSRLEKAKEYVSNLVRKNEIRSYFSIMDDAKYRFGLTEDELSLLGTHLMKIVKKSK